MGLDMSVAVDVRRIQLALDELETVTHDRAIPRVMAAALLSSTEQAFERQANPDTGQSWESWSDPWLVWRQEHGFVPGSILTLHGDLARSITTDYGPDYALIGSPKIYAAIHQWGGKPDMPPGPAGVPARPYMGLDKSGEQEIYDAIRKRVSAALTQ
ncbi:phage virion morphogenesis protein [Escherichia albertii]|uniref:phage virion morphogenesis protein n=1 Tax=Escherichia albertii TaxID=208962 RepID=UPI000BF6812D|nr:phage virion morphogenesis protein [Escherichia albertii]PFF95385.1 phage virion morphogenesis protein [Escherichia albertii]